MVVAATILPLMVVWFKRNRDLGRSDDLFWLRVERYWYVRSFVVSIRHD
jgi:hypothetical protein